MPAAKPPEFRRRAVELARREQAGRQDREGSGDQRVLPAAVDELDDVDAGRKEGSDQRRAGRAGRLRRRNRVLEMEIEILKRASAYFARENVLPK